MRWNKVLIKGELLALLSLSLVSLSDQSFLSVDKLVQYQKQYKLEVLQTTLYPPYSCLGLLMSFYTSFCFLYAAGCFPLTTDCPQIIFFYHSITIIVFSRSKEKEK